MSKHRFVKGLAAAAGIASAAWAARTVARSITGAVPEGGVNESMYVNIGGVRQWISIYGKDLNNPVLLFLHGGPGGALSAGGTRVIGARAVGAADAGPHARAAIVIIIVCQSHSLPSRRMRSIARPRRSTDRHIALL